MILLETTLNSICPQNLSDFCFNPSANDLRQLCASKNYEIKSGKVRDCILTKDHIYLLHSDRLSAFDKFIGDIPLKGILLNEINNYWLQIAKQNNLPVCEFKKIDSRTMKMKKLKPFKLEVIVRNYLTGSFAKLYQKGQQPLGSPLKKGLKEYEQLSYPTITPTTKGENGEHDLPLTEKNIISKKICSSSQWESIKKIAIELFKLGSKIYKDHGWILVDTKYEFAQDDLGQIFIIDEIHTPDSSRLWKENTYETRIKNHLPPDMFDKEIIRAYLQSKGFGGKGTIPLVPKEKTITTLRAYQTICLDLIKGPIEINFSLTKLGKYIQKGHPIN
jgi:phosphoribosylaminoimidazole-succinocarboxamide synthase